MNNQINKLNEKQKKKELTKKALDLTKIFNVELLD